jgi:hypothetical protein
MGTLTHKTHHGPDSRKATTFPHIVFSAAPRRSYIRMAHFPGTPKLESRNCPETVQVGVPEFWELISPDCQVWSRRGLNKSYSSLRELSNAMSHSRFGCREEVDSRLLVVGSQTTSLTPGPSFAHSLGCKCPNDQCEAIFDIYTSRPFQWNQEHPNVRCFGFYCRTLNIRESRRTPNPQLWEWGFILPLHPKWSCDNSHDFHISQCTMTKLWNPTIQLTPLNNYLSNCVITSSYTSSYIHIQFLLYSPFLWTYDW